jgi:D-tyrosyl-tRNA(Tyr) deacylase
MIGLLQRVTGARVEADGNVVAAIAPGLVVLACAQRGDTKAQARRLLNFRVLADVNGQMDVSLRNAGENFGLPA